MVIHNFADDEVSEFFILGKLPRKAGWKSVQSIAKRKLDMLHYAVELNDLRSPPGNRLEALKGSLSGYYSIRINDQWRIVFKWTSHGAENVKIIDYH